MFRRKKEKLRKSNIGKKHVMKKKKVPMTEEHKQKIREIQKQMKNWTNGISNKRSIICPDGYWRGTTKLT